MAIKLLIKENVDKITERYELADKLYHWIIEEIANSSEVNEWNNWNNYRDISLKSNLLGTTYKGQMFDKKNENGDDDGFFRIYFDLEKVPGYEFLKGKKVTVPAGWHNGRNHDQPFELEMKSIILYLDFFHREEKRELGNVGGSYDGVHYSSDGSVTICIMTYQCRFKDLDSFRSSVLELLQAERSTLLHEISHMFDDIHIMGVEKFAKIPYTKSFSDKYFNSAIEMNARWSEVIHQLKGVQYTNYNPNSLTNWNDKPEYQNTIKRNKLRSIEKDEGEGNNITFEQDWLSWDVRKSIWESKLTKEVRKKFILDLYQLFISGPHELPDRYVQREAATILKEYFYRLKHMDVRNYPPKETRKHFMIDHIKPSEMFFGDYPAEDLYYDWNEKTIRATCWGKGGDNKYSQQNTEKIINKFYELAEPFYQEAKEKLDLIIDQYPEKMEWD